MPRRVRASLSPARLLVAAAVLAAATPAGADWLQMRDGSRLETRGPWEVRGVQVVFTLPNGTLASTRTAAVDLEASQRLTTESQAPPRPAAPAPAPRKPVVVLTDADVGHVSPLEPVAAAEATSAAGTPPASAAAAATPTAATDSGLQLLGWSSRYSTEDGATVLGGSLSNPLPSLAYDIKVVVSSFDARGGLLARSDATVSAPGVPPGGTTSFEVRYPGVIDIKDAKFEISAQRAALKPDEKPAAREAAPAPTPAPPVDGGNSGRGSEPARLQVARWQPETVEGSTALSLVGDLANQSSAVAYDVRLLVTVLAADGSTIASSGALLGSTQLQPGQSTNFRVSFPGVETYQDVRFEARHNVRTAVTRTVPATGGR